MKKIYKCKVIKVQDYGLLVELYDNRRGLIHISNVASYYIKNLNNLFKNQDVVYATIIDDSDPQKLSLSLSSGHRILEKRTNPPYKEVGGGFNILAYYLEKNWTKENLK